MIHCRARSPRGWASAALIEDRWLALPSERSLYIVDLEAIGATEIDLEAPNPPGIVARFDEVTSLARGPGVLLLGDRDGVIHRVERAAGFRATSAWRIPDDFRNDGEVQATSLGVSPCGRFLYVQVRNGAYLVDVTTWKAHAIPRTSPAGHASFTRLPSGDEVLFASLPSYMGISMYDCASGEVVRRFHPTSGFDFCHVSYELSAEGDRLFAFGCVWAGPYAARIYDARPWVFGPRDAGAGPSRPFDVASIPEGPLRLVFEHAQEVGQLGDALRMRATPSSDGCATCVTLVARKDVPARGSEEDADVREDYAGELAVYEELQALREQDQDAVVVRRVDSRDGRVVGVRVLPAPTAAEGQVSVLAEHRLLAVGKRIELLDGVSGDVQQLGTIEVLDTPDSLWTTTLLSSNLATAVIVRYARTSQP